MKVKFLSWNIWQGKHFEGILDFLKDQMADIVALQEIREQNGFNLADEIANRLNLRCFYAKAFSTDRHSPKYDLGEAILTRFNILDSERELLSGLDSYNKTAETEPRVLVRISVKINNKILQIFNTHLAYSNGFKTFPLRLLQVKKLMSYIPKNNAILAGDLNSLPKSKELSLVTKQLINVDKKATDPTWTIYPFNHGEFTASKLKYRLDNIFVTKDINYSNFRIEKSLASDHLPISVELNI